MNKKVETALHELAEHNITHEVFNDGLHIRIYEAGQKIDLWASTGTWKVKVKGGYQPEKHKTGLKGVLKYLYGDESKRNAVSLLDEIAQYHIEYPDFDALSPANVLHFKEWLIKSITKGGTK